MICPKCGRPMLEINGISLTSNLSRDTQHGIVHGWECMNCHKWLEAEFEPVCKYHPVRPVAALYHKSRPATVADKFVWSCRESIWKSRRTEEELISWLVERCKHRGTKRKSIINSLRRLENGQLKAMYDDREEEW